MESSETVVRRLRPTSVLPFIAWAGLLAMQLISPDRVWSWLLVGLSVMLLVGYIWARPCLIVWSGSAARWARGWWPVTNWPSSSPSSTEDGCLCYPTPN